MLCLFSVSVGLYLIKVIINPFVTSNLKCSMNTLQLYLGYFYLNNQRDVYMKLKLPSDH